MSLDQALELHAGQAESRIDRSGLDAENRRDLRGGHLFEFGHDEDGALVFIELLEEFAERLGGVGSCVGPGVAVGVHVSVLFATLSFAGVVPATGAGYVE